MKEQMLENILLDLTNLINLFQEKTLKKLYRLQNRNKKFGDLQNVLKTGQFIVT
jgi:hypothetical protein